MSAQCDVTSLDAASFFNSIKSARPSPLSISASCYTREKRVEWCVCVCVPNAGVPASSTKETGGRNKPHHHLPVQWQVCRVIYAVDNKKQMENSADCILKCWKDPPFLVKKERDTPIPSHHSHSIAQLHPAEDSIQQTRPD